MTSIKQNTKNTFTVFLRNTVVSACMGLIISVIVLFVISLFVVRINKHELIYPILAVIIQSLPALISGSIIGKIYGHSLLIFGIIEGIIISFLYLLISFSVNLGNINFNAFFASVPYVVSSSVLGVIMSGSKKKKIK